MSEALNPCAFCDSVPFHDTATNRAWCVNASCKAQNVPFWENDWQTRSKEWKEQWIKKEG
jgi:hypothetical protein